MRVGAFAHIWSCFETSRAGLNQGWAGMSQTWTSRSRLGRDRPTQRWPRPGWSCDFNPGLVPTNAWLPADDPHWLRRTRASRTPPGRRWRAVRRRSLVARMPPVRSSSAARVPLGASAALSGLPLGYHRPHAVTTRAAPRMCADLRDVCDRSSPPRSRAKPARRDDSLRGRLAPPCNARAPRPREWPRSCSRATLRAGWRGVARGRPGGRGRSWSEG